ncbi:taste receptor type 2 member 3-like [Astyanax mexicanus]|uniref:Taste receptor type 2 n=1 Tax=Astyanax mexicanus TaxID=7994 RepID=A0A8B9LAW0_ASTMX|nr:taste receptor type 2 member 3-like [Astyanax mexicanus]
MELVICICVNLPCAVLGLLMNMFYVFCLIFPLGGEMNVRQPLMTLLVLVICCTSTFQLCFIIHLSLEFMAIGGNLKQIVDALMSYAVRVSIPASLWLNIFYCSQIIPVTYAPFIWLKKNIKTVVYFLLISTKIYFLTYFVLEILMSYGIFSRMKLPQVNSTVINGSYASVRTKFQISSLLDILDTLTMVLIMLGLCVMLIVTGSTGRYLYKHIRKMTSSGMPFNSQTLQNQVRVTLTSFIQGFIYLLFTVGAFIDVYCAFKSLVFDWDIVWMLHNLYSLATIINLGVGQSLFRQRVAHLCQKALNIPSS